MAKHIDGGILRWTGRETFYEFSTVAAGRVKRRAHLPYKPRYPPAAVYTIRRESFRDEIVPRYGRRIKNAFAISSRCSGCSKTTNLSLDEFL